MSVRPVLWLVGSPESWQAFRYALELVARRGSGLVVVCTPDLAERARSEAKAHGVTVEVRTPATEPPEVLLLRTAEEEGAELIVAASRTPTGKVVLGDRLTTILLNAPGPVILFKPPRPS